MKPLILTDTFFMWYGEDEYSEEVRMVHEVYAAAQQYGEFLDKGYPINYNVPDPPGTVISGLISEDRVLIRRTDFGNNRDPVRILAGTSDITVDFTPGQYQVIPLNNK